MKIQCSSCNQPLELSLELVGQTVVCPSCNESLTVPASTEPQKRPSLIIRFAVGLLGLLFMTPIIFGDKSLGSVGGFGSHVSQLLADRGVFDNGLKFRSMILPDSFIDQDTPFKMYDQAGLNSNDIVNKIEETLKSNIIFATNKNKLNN